MTENEIRKLLGGYATDALSADERRILFEAALDDQELFNALQNEDALKELLADPGARAQVRRALGTPATRRREFHWRRWLIGVATPAVVAVMLIVVMNRANAPRLIGPPAQIASNSAAAPVPEPETARAPVQKQSAVKRAPARVLPAPVQPEPALDSRNSNAVARSALAAPAAAPNAPFRQEPPVRYSLIRGGQDADSVRVDVTAGIAGLLTLYRVDAAGNIERLYPVNDAAAQVVPNVAMQIPAEPVKVGAGEKLRLILVPALLPAINGAIGAVVGGVAGGTPIVIDIPVEAN